ncbi:MAG: pectinesterase family protein [bacterium]|nr:pectinesterase family protein [bacterium]
MKRSRILSTIISVAMLASCFTAVTPASAAPEDADEVSMENGIDTAAELMDAEEKTYDFTAMTQAPVYSEAAGSGFVGTTSSVGSRTTDAGKSDTSAGTGRTVAAPETITMNGGASTDNAAGMVFRVDVAPGAYRIVVTGVDGTTKSNTAVAVSGMEASRITGTGAWDTAGLVKRTAPAAWTDNVWSYDYVTGENFIEVEIEGIGGAAVGVASISITPLDTTIEIPDKPTVFVLGDSTQKTYTFEENSMSGYGQVLNQMFDLSKVNVVNYSMGGRSMRTNYQEGRFNDVLLTAKPGDYVFIHSAHNDETSDEMNRFGRGTSAGMYKNFLENVYIPAIKAMGAIPVLVTSMPRTSDGQYKESAEKPNGFNPDSPGMMRAVAENDDDVKLIELYEGSKKYIDEIGKEETVYIYQSLEAGETAGKTNSGSYANGHPDNKIDGTHYKEAYAKQLARIIAQDIYAQKDDPEMGILANVLSDEVKAACEDGDWTKHVFPEMAKDVSTVGGASQGTNAYYRNQIEKMLQLGVMAKDSEGNFNPKAPMTVGSFANSLTKAWSLDTSVLSDYTGNVEEPDVTDKPNETDKPGETTAPVDAVKAVVTYDANGRLTGLSLDTSYKYTGSVEAVAGSKVLVWNNMTDMEPLCNPVTEAATASLSEAGDTLSWVCSAADSGCAEGHELFPGLTTLFADNKNNGKYIQAKDNCDWNDDTGVATKGAGLKFVAPEDGTITLTLASLGAGKSAHIIEEGKTLADAVSNIEGPNTVLSGFVTGGKTYYLIGKGTKPGMSEAKFVPGAPATPAPKPTVDPNASPEPELVEKTAIDKDAALTREAMAAIIYDAYEAKFGKAADGSWNKPVYMTDYNGTNLPPDDPNYDPNLTGASSQYYPLVGWGALTDIDRFHTSLYGKAKEVYNLGLMRSEKGIERGKMVNGTEMEPLTVVTREKAAKELYFLYNLIQDKKTENQVIPGDNMAFTLTEELAVPDESKPSYPGGAVKPGETTAPTTPPEETTAPTSGPVTDPTTKPGELPADEAWTSNDEELMTAATGAADGVAFGPVNGLSGIGGWKQQNASAAYTHTNGQTYTFTSAFRAGTGSESRRNFYFTPKQACIVTVAYTSQAGRPVYIYQGGKLLASGEEGTSGGVAATITADVEDPSLGDVYVYGGSSNKDIFAIFADYYDPNMIVNRRLSGKINYAGSETGLNVVFTDTKDQTTYTVPAVNGDYSVEVRQNRSYDITVVDAAGTVSDKVAVTLDTNTVSVAKMDKTQDINLVDIGLTEVSGDVVVHDINNDGITVDLSKVQLAFTANDDNAVTYTTGIADNKIKLSMMPNHEYTVTATGIDGYELSPLSSSYVMAAGDTAPFKNILITETIGEVPFSATVEVGANKAYARINDALAAVKAMKDRPAGEAGRVNVLIDPGVYTEQVIVDSNYVTIKAADAENRPEIQWYYGIGYLYYSSAGNQYYSEDYAVQKTKKGPVTRWGAACRITGQYCNLESIIIRHTFNCDVTEAELADGVAPALNNEYSDTNGKPDRTVAGYDARTKAATERAAAIALDGGYTELYKCDFISSQDTFYTNKTAYVKECYIEGGTDFIYGGNSILFEDCTLAWHGYSDQQTGGYLTACKTSGPSTGTANEATNGYMFKNTTVTTSKYYPDNRFHAGSWGRNWGGTDCQVVFDGVKLEGVDAPGAWVKMGGELSTSILFVNNVTDKDGNAVDVSGTSFNPNGTMESKGYTMIKDTDYFGGTWVPQHYDKAIVLDEYTSTWYFGKSNGAPEYNMQGAGAVADIAASSSNNPAVQTLKVNAEAGKFANNTRTDEWVQWNAGTVLTVPVVNGSTIQLATYQSNGTYTINGKAIAGDAAYTYYGTAETVDIVSTNGGYLASVKVVSPANPSTDIPTPPPATDVTGTITGLDAADASAVKLVVSLNNVATAIDVTDGAFTASVQEGAEPVVVGVFGGVSAYTIPEGAKLVYGETAQTIAVEKVAAETVYGSKTYTLSDGSVFPKLGTDYVNFVTQDGLVKFNNVKYHNDHGVTNSNGTLTINVAVPAGDSTISFNGCAYAADTTVITAPSGVSPVSTNLKTTADNSPIDFTYSGEETDLTFTISGGSIYLHALTVKTTNAAAAAQDAIFNFTPANNGYIESTSAAASDYYFQGGAVVVTKDARYHNDHGLSMPAGDVITIRAGGPMDISIGSCQYSSATVTLKGEDGAVIDTAEVGGNALAGKCYKNDPTAKATLHYAGAGETLTINMSGSTYFPALGIKNVAQ